MITIDELMTTNPFTLRETDTLEDARRLMTEKHIRHVPVTDSDQQLKGLVTQRDVLEATNPESQGQSVKLSKIMIKKVSVIHSTDSVRQAAIYLQQHKYGCLPVVNDNRLVGIVTDSDYIGVAINLLEQVELTEDNVDFEADDMDDLDIPKLDEEF